MQVGFIGLGSQGGPMAEAIHEAGFAVRIWARRESVRAAFAQRGVGVAHSPSELAALSDVLCLCVTNDDDVRELAEEAGVLDALRPGSVLVIHSTVSPNTCETLAQHAARRDVAMLDAPVSGSGEAVRNRRLLVLVGGPTEVVERVRPIFETYGNPVVHVGAVGDGQRAKIVNNFACIANMAVADLALHLGASVGLSRAELREALLQGSGRSFALDVLDRLVRPDTAEHVAGLFSKDMLLADSLAEEGGIDLSSTHRVVSDFLDDLRRNVPTDR